MQQSRPTQYSPELGEKLCNKLATCTHSLVKICSEEDMPLHTTVLKWLSDPDNVVFLQSYLLAREIQAELLIEEMIAIADEVGEKDSAVHVSRARLRLDVRKWKATKLLPEKYSAADMETGGDDETASAVEWGGVIIPL